MRIVVFIKQVPVLSAMEFDPATKTLKREGLRSEVSSFDIRAIIKAVDLRDLHGGEVVAVTMGPPQARTALVDCLALGADRGVHLCDRLLAGSDTLATARALAAAARQIGFDLILTGRSSVDAETGQVGPEVAELLDLPQITAAHSIEIDVVSRRLVAERETDDGYERLATALPVLVTAAEDLAAERFPNRAERESAVTKEIITLDLNELRLNPQQVGATGSPTYVADLRPITLSRRQFLIEGTTVDDAAGRLARILVDEHGLFREWKVDEQPAFAEVRRPLVGRQQNVWVVAERQGSQLRPVTFELLGRARDLADSLASRVDVLLLGTQGEPYAGELAARGADRIIFADEPSLSGQVELQTDVLARAIAELKPGIVLLPATSFGRDLAPRVAARTSLGLTGDCLDVGLDERGRLIQFKPAFGGSVVALILSRTTPEMATIRPGMLKARRPIHSRRADLLSLDTRDLSQPRIEILGLHRIAATAAALDVAEIVIGVGKGLAHRDNLVTIQPLIDLLQAEVCTTRDVTDDGWLPRQYQVGLTGRAIAPKLYIAVAIRGAFEHMVGVRRAGLVVAINRNAKAPIFKACDYGLVADYQEAVAALHRHLQQLRPAPVDGSAMA